MITCPSCNHQNPEGSLQCENCYTPLPVSLSCPNCGASVQADATFCGQCGFNLQAENSSTSIPSEETAVGIAPDLSLEEIPLPEEIPLSAEEIPLPEEIPPLPEEIPLSAEEIPLPEEIPPLPEEIPLPEGMSGAETDLGILPETSMPSPIQSPWDEEDSENMTVGQRTPVNNSAPELDPPEVISSETVETDLGIESVQSRQASSGAYEPMTNEPSNNIYSTKKDVEVFEPQAGTTSNMVAGATQLQIQTANLLHLQSNTTIEFPSDLDVVHIGKPNGHIPPDIDVAGFPDSEIVSRVHADIRVEGDAYFVEDVGSSNGTYVNHTPLVRGNRHKLRPGDRIALGKGDLVTFIFQMG